MRVKYRRNGEAKEIEGKILNFLECIESKTDSPEYWLTFLEGSRAGVTVGVTVAPIVRTLDGWII